jgi:predicted ester cyclase
VAGAGESYASVNAIIVVFAFVQDHRHCNLENLRLSFQTKNNNMKRFLILAASMALLVSCKEKVAGTYATNSDSASMQSSSVYAKQERNKQIALASVRGFDQESIDSILKNADSNTVEYGDGSMAPVRGVDSVRKMMSMWLNAFPDYKGNNFIVASDSNHVMVYGEWAGTWKNDLMGMKATGKPFKVNDVDIFTFNDNGKITEHRSVQSMNTIAMQTGMPMMKDSTKK